MREAPNDRGRKLGASYWAKIAERCHVDRPKLIDGRVDARAERTECVGNVGGYEFRAF